MGKCVGSLQEIEARSLKLTNVLPKFKAAPLNTRWKRSYGLPIFFYGFSCLFLLIYFLFSHLSKIKLGNAIYQPLIISTCIILAFVVFKITNNKVSIDRKKLSEAGLEIQLFETETQAKLSQYFLKYRN
jgi:hypothetical protein